MNIQLDMPTGLEDQLKAMVFNATQQALEQYKQSLVSKDWFSLKEACEYAGVSNATMSKFRTLGLKVCEVDNVKRVARKEIDRFLEENSY